MHKCSPEDIICAYQEMVVINTLIIKHNTYEFT